MIRKIKYWIWYNLIPLKKKTYSLDDVKVIFTDYEAKEIKNFNIYKTRSFDFIVYLPDVHFCTVKKMAINYSYNEEGKPTVTVWYERPRIGKLLGIIGHPSVPPYIDKTAYYKKDI